MRAPLAVSRKEVNISTYDEPMVGRDFRSGASTLFIYCGNPPLWAGAPAAHPLSSGHIRTICGSCAGSAALAAGSPRAGSGQSWSRQSWSRQIWSGQGMTRYATDVDSLPERTGATDSGEVSQSATSAPTSELDTA